MTSVMPPGRRSRATQCEMEGPSKPTNRHKKGKPGIRGEGAGLPTDNRIGSGQRSISIGGPRTRSRQSICWRRHPRPHTLN